MGEPAPLQASTGELLFFPELKVPLFPLLVGKLFAHEALELAKTADRTRARIDVIAAYQMASMARRQLRRCWPSPARPWPPRGSRARAIGDEALVAWSEVAPLAARFGALLRGTPGRLARARLDRLHRGRASNDNGRGP